MKGGVPFPHLVGKWGQNIGVEYIRLWTVGGGGGLVDMCQSLFLKIRSFSPFFSTESIVMSRYFYIPVFSLMAVMMSNCAGTIALHDFSYHGTDAVLANNSFFYVQQAVVGKATTEYDLRAGSGGFVRDGLVADAKNDLVEQSPLGPNQTYANMAIDVITENIGYWWGGTHFVKRIRLSAVVSADIVEFGEPTLRSQVESSSRGTLPRSTATEEETPEPSSSPSSQAEVKSKDDSNQPAFAKHKKGDFVWIRIRKEVLYGYVEDVTIDGVQVRFNQDGREKLRWLYAEKIFKTKEEAEAN